MRSLVVTMKKVDIPLCIAVSTFLLMRIITKLDTGVKTSLKSSESLQSQPLISHPKSQRVACLLLCTSDIIIQYYLF